MDGNWLAILGLSILGALFFLFNKHNEARVRREIQMNLRKWTG